MVEGEPPYTRAVALFGLYTFFYTQPSGTAPALHRVAHIAIPIGAMPVIKESLVLLIIPQTSMHHSKHC